MCADWVLHRIFPTTYVEGVVPSETLLVMSTAIFFVASIIGGWICAKIAPDRVARQLQWLFVIGELAGLIPTYLNWNKGWPHWYSIAWLLVWPLALWVGMKLAGSKSPNAA